MAGASESKVTNEVHGVRVGNEKESETVAEPSPEWHEMERYRHLPRVLRGGVLALQDAGRSYIWQAPRERDEDYGRRLAALQFDPFFWLGCEHLGGQPFSREISFSDDAPPELVSSWRFDIDGTGRDLRALSRSACINSTGYGLDFLWVVWSAGDQRPYILRIPAESVLDPYEPGAPVRVAFTDEVRDQDKPWIRRKIDQIWIFYDGEPTAGGDDRYSRYEIYERTDREDSESDWSESPVDGGFFRPLTTIPLVPVPTSSNHDSDAAPWVSMPPHIDAAVSNLVWANKRSDLDAGINIANIPQMCGSGVTKGDKEILKGSSRGFMTILTTEKPDGKFYFCTHDGAAFELSFKDMSELERRMEVMMHSPNVTRANVSGAITATGELKDLERVVTVSQARALIWQDSIQHACRIATRYRRLNDSFTVELFTGFGPKERDLERAALVQRDYLEGDLPPIVYYTEMKRLGVYTEAFDAEGTAQLVESRRKETLSLTSAPPRRSLPAARAE